MKKGFKMAVNLISTEPQFIALRSNSQRYYMGFTSWKDIVVFFVLRRFLFSFVIVTSAYIFGQVILQNKP